MAAPGIEIILNRQLADCLSVPVFIVDPLGTLLFFNEPAEKLLGSRFEETGELKAEQWSTMFTPVDNEGNVIPPEELPLIKTLNAHRPAHGSFWIHSLKGPTYKISVTTYPIIGRSNKFSGAVAIFWIDNDEQ
jgi:PAS domain-containing protein